MHSWMSRFPRGGRVVLALLALVAVFGATPVHASEAELKLPDLGSVSFLGVAGSTLLLFGLVVCLLGLLFGLVMYTQLKNLPVHKSMREISELIYETCKTYLITQGKFILILWALHRRDHRRLLRLAAALPRRSGGADHPAFSLVGIAGSYGVAWFGIRDQHLRQLAHGLRAPARQALPDLRHPAQGRHDASACC